MTTLSRLFPIVLFSIMVGVTLLAAQTAATPPQSNTAPPTPPPATKLEAFKPAAGSVVTLGYDHLGTIAGISVEVREMKDARGTSVRGVAVEVTENQYRREQSFIDADELPELLKAFEAIMAVKTNPTAFPSFEVRYTTRGEFQITVFNTGKDILYAVQAGRIAKAQKVDLTPLEVSAIHSLLQGALEKLNAIGSTK